MSPDFGCPICARAKGQHAARIVTDDGVFVAAARHLGTWAQLNAIEQLAMLSAISGALQEGHSNLKFDVVHGHLVLRFGGEPARAETGRPGLLIAGANDPLLTHLARHIDRADSVDMAIAFALDARPFPVVPKAHDPKRP